MPITEGPAIDDDGAAPAQCPSGVDASSRTGDHFSHRCADDSVMASPASEQR